jgi:hypothetical protein
MPSARASWITQRPTAELPAFCTTHPPCSGRPNPCSSRQAVAGFTLSIAACSGSIPAGSLKRMPASTTAWLAQVAARRRKITRSPGWKSGDSLARISAQPSTPGVAGSAGFTP